MDLRIVVAIFFFILFFSCQEKNNTVGFIEKEEKLKIFVQALQQCKASTIDSILFCSQQKVLTQNIESDTTLFKIWKNYGHATALARNNFLKEAVPYINEALPLTESYPYLLEQAKLLDLRSSINTSLNNWMSAASDTYQAGDIYVDLGFFSNASLCYLNVCNLQYNSGNYELAIENGKQSLSFLAKSKSLTNQDSSWSINGLNTLGLAYFQLKNLDSATKYFNLSHQYAVRTNNELWMGLVEGNSARIDLAKGNKEVAIQKLKKKLAVCQAHREFASAGAALVSLAEIEMDEHHFTESKKLYDSAWRLINLEKRPRTKSAYFNSVSTWYERSGNYKEAHAYTKKYMDLRDSMQGGNPISAQLLQAQSKNQFKKQMADLSLLKAENEVKNQELKVWQISIVAIIIISVLMAVLLNTINKNYKKLNELNSQLESKVRTRTTELVKINKELDTYLYRSSHDVRRPILSIIGLTQLTHLVKGERELREIQQKIDDTARAMDKMLSKLQMAYELDKVTDLEPIEISDYLRNAIFTSQRTYPSIRFEFNSDVRAWVQSNTKLLSTIFENLLENACIFSTFVMPKVNVEILQNHESISIVIADNGIGIDKIYWAEIFKPYTRFSERSVGSGLGLHLVEKALRKMNGSIVVDSTLYKGSKFTITIPTLA